MIRIELKTNSKQIALIFWWLQEFAKVEATLSSRRPLNLTEPKLQYKRLYRMQKRIFWSCIGSPKNNNTSTWSLHAQSIPWCRTWALWSWCRSYKDRPQEYSVLSDGWAWFESCVYRCLPPVPAPSGQCANALDTCCIRIITWIITRRKKSYKNWYDNFNNRLPTFLRLWKANNID